MSDGPPTNEPAAQPDSQRADRPICVVRGAPTPEELAAVLAVLARRSGAEVSGARSGDRDEPAAGAGSRLPAWVRATRPRGPLPPPHPRGWRDSVRPD